MSLQPLGDASKKDFVKWLIRDKLKCEWLGVLLKTGPVYAFSISVLAISIPLQLTGAPFTLGYIASSIMGYLLGRGLYRKHFAKFRWITIKKEGNKTKLSLRTYLPKVTKLRYGDENIKLARTETFDHKFKVFAVFSGKGKVPPNYQPTMIVEPSRKSILLGFDDLDQQASSQRLLELFSTMTEDTGTITSDLFKSGPRQWDKITAIGTIIVILINVAILVVAVLQFH